MDWKPDGDPEEVGRAARGQERRPHAHQLHHVPPMSRMSCDDNHEARSEGPRAAAFAPDRRARASRRRPPARKSTGGASRSATASGADARAPPTSSRPARSPSSVDGKASSRRGFMQLLSVSTAVAAVGAACQKPQREDRPVRAPARRGHAGQPAALRHRVRAGRLRQRPAGREPRGPPDQDRRQPRPPADARRDDRVRAGADPGPLRRRSRQAAPHGADAARLAHAARARSTAPREQLAENRGAGLRFLIAPDDVAAAGAICARRILERFPQAKFVSYSSVADDGAVEGARWRSASRWCRATACAGRRHPVAGRRLPGRGRRADAPVARVRGAPRAEPADEPPLRRRAGADRHRRDGRPPPAPAGHARSAAFVAALCLDAGQPRAWRRWRRSRRCRTAQRKWDMKWLVAVADDLRAPPRQQPGHRRPPPAGRRARAGRRAQRRARQRRRHRRLRRAADAATRWRAPRRWPPWRRTSPPARSTRWSSRRRTRSTRARRLQVREAARARAQLHLLTRSTRTRRPRRARPSSPRRTRSRSWGDVRATDGTVSIVQPLIAPLWGGIQEADAAGRVPRRGRRRRAQAAAPASGRAQVTGAGRLRRQLGALAGRRHRPGHRRAGRGRRSPSTAPRWRRRSTPLLPRGKQGMEIAFVADPKVYDGRFANNAWLQELPHPITKLTWDNAAMLVRGDGARRSALETGDIVEVSYRDRRIDAPVLVVPGHADDAVTLPLGYGRTGRRDASRKASASTPARCAPATPPGSTAASTLAKTGAALQVRASPRTTGRWHRTAARSRRRPSRRRSPRCSTRSSKFHEEIEDAPRHPLPTLHEPVDYSKQPYKWAHGDRPQQVHRLQRLRRRLPGREQHPGRRQGERRAAAARCTGCASTATSRGRSTIPTMITQPLDVRALRDGALRVRLPGQRHRPQRRGPQRDGLQPLHRHPLLHQQLPVQGPPLQLPQLHRRRHRRARRWG